MKSEIIVFMCGILSRDSAILGKFGLIGGNTRLGLQMMNRSEKFWTQSIFADLVDLCDSVS